MIKVLIAEKAADREYARRIRHRIFVEEEKIPEAIESEGDEESLHFLAAKEGLYVCAGRYRVKGPFLKIERVATLPEARGKGAATELMLFMQALGSKEHPRHLQILHSLKKVELFYRKLGWIPVGKPFQEAGLEHQLMILPPKEPSLLQSLLCLKDPSSPAVILDELYARLQDGHGLI